MLELLRAEGPNFYELGASSLQQRTYYYYYILPLAGIRSLLGLELLNGRTVVLCELHTGYFFVKWSGLFDLKLKVSLINVCTYTFSKNDYILHEILI